MTHKKQIFFIILLATLAGLARFSILNDPDFKLIKSKRIVETVNTFSIPQNMTSPMGISLEFAEYLFNEKLAIFLDARDPEDFNQGHIESSVNIPYDYYEDYEESINSLDDTFAYVIYCSGEECSLSMDLADYLFNELLFENVLVFEGGWPQWRDANLPSSKNNLVVTTEIEKEQKINIDQIISWLTFFSSLLILVHFISIKGFLFNPSTKLNQLDISILPRLILGLVFIFASYHKILDPASFSENINNFHITPAFVENLAGLIIPWLELILGVFLILGLFLEGTTSITIGLYIFFITILSQALYRGIDVHCGCFKTDADLSAADLRFGLIKRIIEDFLLLGMAFICKQKKKILNG